MASPNYIRGDLHVQGGLSCESLIVPANAVGNSQVPAAANIDADKLQHRHEYIFGDPYNKYACDIRAVCAVITTTGATGSVVRFCAGSSVANIGNATVVVDLLKNGTTILTAPITLTSTHTAREIVDATINTSTIAENDVFEWKTTVTPGTGTEAMGLFIKAIFDVDCY